MKIRFQWGHDITVVETEEMPIELKEKYIVSMGPRHYSRGNLKVLLEFILYNYCFNGATTLQSWKLFVRFLTING